MDYFKKAQYNYIGIGGIKCNCCCDLARKNRGRNKDKKLNKIARSLVKRDTVTMLLNCL
jgi:hypothetical protein